MKVSLFFSALIFTCFAFAQDDVLLKKSLTLKTSDLAAVMNTTEENIKLFVDYFDVKLDSNTKIISPKSVIGTQQQPVLKVTLKKCVFFICQTIDLDAEFSLEKTNGSCDFNYQLIVDLQRSSGMLTNLYSHIKTDICIQKTSSGAQAQLTVNLIHAASYSSGIVQKQAYGLISLQGASLLESFKKVMKVNGVLEVL
jgi:hypothetical protein